MSVSARFFEEILLSRDAAPLAITSGNLRYPGRPKARAGIWRRYFRDMRKRSAPMAMSDRTNMIA
jgi:hypothetical protein